MLVFFMLVGMTVGMLMHLNHPKDEGYFFKFLGRPFGTGHLEARGTCQMLPFLGSRVM